MGRKHSALSMISFLKKYFILVALFIMLLVGVFFRFYRLSEFPVGFHLDEAISGVNGYYLLQTGKDSNNNFLPLQTEVFGDYNPTGYAYLSTVPIRIFDLSEFSTRFSGALLGSLTILALFLLTFSIFKSVKISLLSAFLITISPWHINFSRSSEQTLVSLFFVVLGFSLVFLSLENKKIKLLISGTTILALSFFMYFTPRIFVPFIFLITLFYNDWQKKINKKYNNFLLISFAFLALLSFFLIFVVRGGENRFKQVSIFNSTETRLVTEERIREDGVMSTNIKITQLFHNKLTDNLLTYASNYLDYFSGNFLFLKGGLPVWFKIDGIGLIYLIELPFLLTGLVLLLVSKNKMHKIPLLWLFTAPLIAALTADDVPNIRRSLLMFPMIEVISAFGFLFILQKIKGSLKILLIVVVSAFLVYNFSYFIHQYIVHAKVHRTWYRNNGFPEMIKTVMKSFNEYDKILITKGAGGIYPLILFYTKFDPKEYQKILTKDKEYTGFGKFFFVPQGCPSVNKSEKFPKGRLLYVDNGDCPDKDLTIYKKKIIINREDGTRAFRIVYE